MRTFVFALALWGCSHASAGKQMEFSECELDRNCPQWTFSRGFDPNGDRAFFDRSVEALLASDANQAERARILPAAAEMVLVWEADTAIRIPKEVLVAKGRTEAIELVRACGKRSSLVEVIPGSTYVDENGAILGIDVFVKEWRACCDSGAFPVVKHLSTISGIVSRKNGGWHFLVTLRSVS